MSEGEREKSECLKSQLNLIKMFFIIGMRNCFNVSHSTTELLILSFPHKHQVSIEEESKVYRLIANYGDFLSLEF